MLSCSSSCYELARTLSKQGFTVAVRPAADRPLIGLAVTCAACGTRYELRPTRPQSVTTLAAAPLALAGA